jgi:hypothetical protein
MYDKKGSKEDHRSLLALTHGSLSTCVHMLSAGWILIVIQLVELGALDRHSIIISWHIPIF